MLWLNELKNIKDKLSRMEAALIYFSYKFKRCVIAAEKSQVGIAKMVLLVGPNKQLLAQKWSDGDPQSI